MKRRDSLRTIVLSGAGAGLVLSGCKTEASKGVEESIEVNQVTYGRTPAEKAHDEKIMSETFFNTHEMDTVEVLCDLIIPADDDSPSATEAGVPEFIEFMMKDYPPFQTRLRGGLMWMDHQSNELVNTTFKNADPATKIKLLDRIAYPDHATPEDGAGVKFFTLFRNLTATGYFTSELGIKVLNYKGNIPNVWDGVPQEVLDKHQMTYDPKYASVYVNPDDRNSVIQWDEDGNITG